MPTGDGVDPIALGLRPGVAGHTHGEQSDDDEHERDPSRPALDASVRGAHRRSRSSWMTARQEVGRDLGDHTATDDAIGIDDPRLRHLRDTEGDREPSVVVEDHRPVAALVGEELLDHGLGLTSDSDGVELGAVGAEPCLLVDEADQLRVLAPARHAVRGEEVEHHPTALAPREVERRAVGERAGRGRCRTVEQRGVGRLVGGAVGAREHDEQTTQHDGHRQGDERRDGVAGARSPPHPLPTPLRRGHGLPRPRGTT